MNREVAAEAVRKTNGNVSAAARALGVHKSTVQRAMKHFPSVAQTKCAVSKTPGDPIARTLADFRKEHDQTWKIRDGLRRLFGGSVIMTDAEFREAVNGNPSRWRAAADQTDFKENRYRVGGELLWAHKDTIRAMRKIRGEAI
jgi:hypothetical protein